MARIEVDEADFAASAGITRVVQQIMAHPEARKMLMKARKTVDPSVAIPELDAAEPVNAAVDELRKELSAWREETAAEKQKAAEESAIRSFQQKWATQEAELRARGWRRDGIDLVKKFAEDNGITDLTIAADAWEKRNPPADPVVSGNGMWGFMGEPDKEDTFVADMMKAGGNDDRRLDQEIRAAIADARAPR